MISGDVRRQGGKLWLGAECRHSRLNQNLTRHAKLEYNIANRCVSSTAGCMNPLCAARSTLIHSVMGMDIWRGKGIEK